MLFFSLAVTMVIFALVPLVNGAGIWAVIIAGNFLRSSTFAITNVLIFGIAGIGSTYGGTAMGLASSIGMIGGFLAPPLGNSLGGMGRAYLYHYFFSSERPRNQ
jgi:hypothetical protein